MTLSAIILAALVVLALAVLLICALIGLMALGHFISVNRRPEDDQPPASWLAKQRGDQ